MWLCGPLNVASSPRSMPRGRWESGLKMSGRKMYKEGNCLNSCCIRGRYEGRWDQYYLVQLSL